MAQSTGAHGIRECSTGLGSCSSLTATAEAGFSSKMCSELISMRLRSTMTGLRI
jgi:hypothetical protein